MHDNSGLGSARGGGGMSAASQSKSVVGSAISKKDAMKSLSDAKDL